MSKLAKHVIKHLSKCCKLLNQDITKSFYQHIDNPDIKRSHLFNGRYENIYLNDSHIPELKALLAEACAQAEKILGAEIPGSGRLKAGCWFNHMPPGSITLAHSHDDDDELLSAVYYVSVPVHSGDLIIHTDQTPMRITPKEGLFVFFRPEVIHEVTINNSEHNRLSIGINFGQLHN